MKTIKQNCRTYHVLARIGKIAVCIDDESIELFKGRPDMDIMTDRIILICTDGLSR